jgi:hypothetical protein
MSVPALGSRWIAAGCLCLLALGTFGAGPAQPPEAMPAHTPGSLAETNATARAATPAADSTTNSLSQQLEALKRQLDTQSDEIKALKAQYTGELGSRKKAVEAQVKTDKTMAAQIDTQRQAIQSLQQQLDQTVATNQVVLSAAQKEMRSRLETLQGSIKSSQQAESTQYDTKSFPGSIPIPGTAAAIRIGGFVKMNVVKNFDPIGSEDRFIAGTIPVPQADGDSAVGLTVNQSRLNLDLRELEKGGSLRAFIEADFDGNGDTLRLRHAFGQYNDFLIGKTWSTFMDFDVLPEGVDFEGINGQIHLRQPQIRYFPRIGKNWDLMMSMEDPKPEITGGDGISEIPDFVLSVRREWFEQWHLKTALLFRQIEGRCNCADENTDTVYGWALSASGKTVLPWWDKRDNFIFQLNYGEGYGRYINDLRKIGGQDAVFNPDNGDMSALPVFACYFALQKWWTATTRSNISAGYVKVDTTDFQPDDAYKSTVRMSGNVLWSPTPRVDMGLELLYGMRENKDNEDADAVQLQFATTYRY